MLASQTSYGAQGLTQSSFTHSQHACVHVSLSKEMGAAKRFALCCSTGYCGHMRMYMANRQLYTPCKWNIWLAPISICQRKHECQAYIFAGRTERHEHEVMKQSPAVNPSRDGLTLTHKVASNWWKCLEYSGMGQIQSMKRKKSLLVDAHHQAL